MVNTPENSPQKKEVNVDKLLLMIQGLAEGARASSERMVQVEAALVKKDELIAKVEGDLEREMQEVADLKVKVEARPVGGGGLERGLSEVRIDRTFGEDTSPKALKTFLSHYKLVKDQNDRRGVLLWREARYRAGALRLVLTDEAAEFVDTEDSMDSIWVNDDATIIQKLEERYLKAECIEMNILAFEEAKQLDNETLAAFMTRLQTLVKNAFPNNPEAILRQRAVWRFLTGVRDAEVRKGLITSKWMASKDEAKTYSEILKAAESIMMTRVASQSMSNKSHQRPTTVSAVAGAPRYDERPRYSDERRQDERPSTKPIGSKRKNNDRGYVAAATGSEGSGQGRQFDRANRMMECYFCKETHAGGWQKCAKRAKMDPKWKPGF